MIIILIILFYIIMILNELCNMLS